MPDTNLNDDMLKLVRYRILFVKRDYEVAFPEQEELVSDKMTETAFIAWKVAEFMQRLRDTPLPPSWVSKDYPSNQLERPPDEVSSLWQAERQNGSARRIHWLPEGDKRYLRVEFEVVTRYPREKCTYEERRIEVLADMANVIQDCAERGQHDTVPGRAGPSLTASDARGTACDSTRQDNDDEPPRPHR